MTLRKKLLLVLLGVPAIPALVLLIFFYLLPHLVGVYARDIAPPDDTDLRLPVAAVPQEDNAYYPLKDIDTALYGLGAQLEIVNAHMKGKAWDGRFVTEFLARTREARELFDRAAQKPKFQDPAATDLGDAPREKEFRDFLSTDILLIRDIARASALQAAQLAKQGEVGRAVEQAMKIIDLGQKIQDSQGAGVHYLMGVGVKRVGLEAMQRIAASPTVTPEMAIRAIKRLDGARPSEAGLRTAFKVEYLVHRKIAQVEQSDFPVGSPLIQTLMKQWGKHFFFQRNNNGGRWF